MKTTTVDSEKRADFTNGVFAIEYPKVLDDYKFTIEQILHSSRAIIVTDKNTRPLFISLSDLQKVTDKNKDDVDLSDLQPDWKRKRYTRNGRRAVAFLSFSTMLHFGFGYLWDL